MKYITCAKCLGLTGSEKLIIFIMHGIVSICNFLITNKNECFSLLFFGTPEIKITFYHLGILDYKQIEALQNCPVVMSFSLLRNPNF